jgi:hypothetical protein
MAKRIVNTRVMAVLLAFAGLMVYGMLVMAGDVEPTAPPGPTMRTLDDIYNAVTASGPQREPFFQEINIASWGYSAKKGIVTMPAGKKLVILKMCVTHYDWRIATCTGTCNLEYQFTTVLNGSTFDGFSDSVQYIHDFPDGCVTVQGGQPLWLVNLLNGMPLKMLLFGYVCDAQ